MKRLVILLIVFLLIALGIFLARGNIHQTLADWTGEEDTEWQLKGLYYLAQSYLQPPYDTVDFAPMKYTDVNPFAINTFFDQEVEEAKVRKSLELIRAAGFHWIRQEFPWEDIEKPSKGTYWETKYNYSTWIKYDLIVHLAQEYGIGVIARLDHPPAWSRHDGRERGDYAPPDNYDDYGDFVETVVKRYRDKIRFYQIWNEPNCCGEWGNLDVSPVDYVRLLKVGYTRAKQADPNAVIISAGLAQTVADDGHTLNDRLFLQQMYDAGARGYFDILAVQDYGLFSGPGDRRLDENDRINFSRPIQLREIMVKSGDANTPIWATEMGWNAQPADFKDTPYGRVDEQRQARYTPQAYYRAQTEWPWMGVMSYWFFRRVDDKEKNQSFYYFRMFEPDFTPLPVYASIKDYTPTARFVDVGFKSATHWAMDWNGDWQAVKDGSAYFGEYKTSGTREAGQSASKTVGQLDSVSFAWRGTDLDLVVKQNPYGGVVRVQIDNDSLRDIELWRTDAVTGGRVSLARDLDSGEHHATITVTRAPVAINGFIVQNGNAWLVQRVGLVVGLLGGLVVGFFAMSRRKR